MSKQTKKIVIIGGGISGLSTAYFLQEKFKDLPLPAGTPPPEIILLEANARLGGKIVSEQVDGFVIEGGPDSFITQKKWGMALVRKMGMLEDLVQTHSVNKSVFVLKKGRLLPLPEGFNLMVPGKIMPFALSPLVSIPGKIRMGLDLVIPAASSTLDESIASFVRRRLGDEALQQFAEPILAGIFAGDAEKLSMKATFPQFLALEKSHGSLIQGMWARKRQMAEKASSSKSAPLSLFVTLNQGLSSLVQKLKETLTDVNITIGNPVTKIAATESGYEIFAGTERFCADAVVITTPTYKAADWLAASHPTLATLLRRIEYVSTATVSLGFKKKDVKHPLDGFGFVIPRKEGSAMMASTWSSTKFPGRAPDDHVLIRVFMGGAYRESINEQEDAELISIVRSELAAILGIEAAPVVSRVFRWPNANPQYHVGHLDLIDKIEKECEQHKGLFLTGAAYRGVGIPDCISQAQTTAEKLVAQLFPTEKTVEKSP